MNGSETKSSFVVTSTVLVNTGGPLHVAASGPNSSNVIVPVGFAPPERCAVSASGAPRTAADVVVEKSGTTGTTSGGRTSTDSALSPQLVGGGAVLWAS